MQENFNTLYSDVKHLCNKVGVTNTEESNLLERNSNEENIVFAKISQRLHDLQSGISSCK